MLLIDIGNSWLKSAYFRDEVLHHICPLEISNFKNNRKICWALPKRKMLSSENIFVSSVASRKVNEKCILAAKRRVLFFGVVFLKRFSPSVSLLFARPLQGIPSY